jgi:hypothetical protein
MTKRLALAAYLTLYFLLVGGAGLVIWRSGLIDHLDRGLIVAILASAVLLGVLLGALSRK